jgi:hypothetical protein
LSAEAGAVEAVASSATSVVAASETTAAIRKEMKVTALERRAGARAQTLARGRRSEILDGLRSPEPAMPELEISMDVRGKRRARRRGMRKEAGIGSGALARVKGRGAGARVSAAQSTRVYLFLLLVKKP